MWQDLARALALVMIIEGFMPFLNPTAMRRTLRMALEMNDKTLRIIGFSSMLLGLFLLYAVK